MFGRKSREIKALKWELQEKDKELVARFNAVKQDALEIAQLHKVRDSLLDERASLAARVEELEAGLRFANQTNKALQDKGVEELIDTHEYTPKDSL